MENTYAPHDQHSGGPFSFKGQFLMAMPGLTDPHFFRSVTCICEHVSDGAVGLVVNQVHTSLSAKDIFDELDMRYVPEAASFPIHLGGPVHIGEVFILHGPPFEWEGCLMITQSLAMSNTRDILEAIALRRGPESFIILLGCAGWGPGQLEYEIKENAWLTCPISEDIIFDTSVDARWEAGMRKMGIDPGFLSDAAGHA